MKNYVLGYKIVIIPEIMNGKTVYNALSPTLGVADWGKTPEKAIEHIKGAIECTLEGLRKTDFPVPPPDK